VENGPWDREGEALSTSIQISTIAPVVPSLAEEAASWYAVMTKARHERVVASRLNEHGWKTFLPLVSEVHRWSDRKKVVEVPLFSSYVFVRLSLTNERRFRVCNTDGVFGLVGSRGEPTSIPDDQIDAVQALVSQKFPWSVHPFLKVGQRVRIRGGSLDGVEGILMGQNGDRTLVVSVDAIQRSLAVRIEGYDLEPV